MCSLLYLKQSRRLAKILKSMFSIKSHWTNYGAWEYKLPNNIDFELAYTNDWNNTKRFNFVETYTRKSLLQTDSLKECVKFIKSIA